MTKPLCQRSRCRETRMLLAELERQKAALAERLKSLGQRDLPLGRRTECPRCHTFIDRLAMGYGKERRQYKIRESIYVLSPPCDHPWHRRKLVKALLAADFTTSVPVTIKKEPTK